MFLNFPLKPSSPSSSSSSSSNSAPVTLDGGPGRVRRKDTRLDVWDKRYESARKSTRQRLKLPTEHRLRFHEPFDKWLVHLLTLLPGEGRPTVSRSTIEQARKSVPRGSGWTLWLHTEHMERYRADKLAVGPKLTHGEFVELLLNLADAAPCHLADPGTPCMSSIGITRNLPKAELHTAPSPLTSSCSTSSGEPGNLLKRELDVKASHLLHLGAPYSSMSGMAGSSTDEDLDGALALVSLAAPVSKNETNNFASIGHHMASPNANADARSVQHFEALPPYGDSKSQPSSTARFLAFQSDIPINHPPQPASLQLTVNHMATVAYPTAPPYRSSLGPVDTSEPLPPYLHTESDVKSETSAKGKDCIVGRESHLYKLASLSTDDLSMLDAVSSSLEGPAWNAFDKPASTSAQPLTGEYHAAFGAHSHAVMDEPLPSYERSIADADSDLELDVKFGDEGADAMECDSSAFDPSTPGIGLDLLADDPLFLPLDAWVSPPGISEADALVWSYEPDLSEPMLTWDLEEGLDSLSDFISFEVSVPPDLKDPE